MEYLTAAFPSHNDANKEYNWINPGMRLRDYFAAHCPVTFEEAAADWQRMEHDREDTPLAYWCRMRFKYADAMLEARRGREEE